jgi:RNA recognition motif-containing protein
MVNPIRITLKKKYREVPKEANLFMKFENPIPVKELVKVLTEKYGPVFTAKISYNESGNPRDYGYVQFEKLESADKCIKDGVIDISGTSVSVTRYLPKVGRPGIKKKRKVFINIFSKDQRRNNLYLKNIPSLKENQNSEDYESYIRDVLIKESKVNPEKVKSILVQEDKNKK